MSKQKYGASLARTVEARTLIEAQTMALRLRIRRGEMINRRAAERIEAEVALRMRDAILSAPARHAAVLAAEVDVPPALMLSALEAVLRGMLERLADEGEQRVLEAEAEAGLASGAA